MAFNVSATITQAINFLTRPLSLIHAPATVNALQSILRSTFYAASLATPNGKLVLTFTLAAPPRPVFAACIAIGIQWAEWIQLLGDREFDLIIEPQSVCVHYYATEGGLPSKTIALWIEPRFTPAKRSLLARFTRNDVPQVPISKLSQSTMAQKQRNAFVAPRIVIPVAPLQQSRTLAQQLLDSDHEEEEADELFAMISKTSIVSPTPTKEQFCLPSYTRSQLSLPFRGCISPISSPEPSSPESSRPSSRSSTFSGYSFADDASHSSVSSAPSLKIERPATKPAPARTEEPVFVDISKKQATKYLYQGGVSSTLTGGVMLGRPAPAAPKAATEQVPKYRAPVGGRKSGLQAPSWRRNAANIRA